MAFATRVFCREGAAPTPSRAEAADDRERATAPRLRPEDIDRIVRRIVSRRERLRAD